MEPRMVASLLRWLGPWGDGEAAPTGAVRHERLYTREGDDDLRAVLYLPRGRRPRGNLIVAHGLSLDGPDNPRFDRLLRILANAGVCVMAPYLRDYQVLEFRPRVADDFEQAVMRFARERLRAHGRRIGLMSISFGSYAALQTLEHHAGADFLSGAVLYGGYADPRATIRYCMGATPSPELPPADPRNMAAVAVNLLPQLESSCDREAVRAAWEEVVRRTWGVDPLAAPELLRPHLDAIAGALQPAERELFMLGMGLQEGSLAVLEGALERSRVPDAMDPRPGLHRITHPVHVMHAASDHTIPVTELQRLQAALPGARSYVTGLYDHTRVKALSREGLPMLGAEARTLLAMLGAIVDVATQPAA